MGNQCFIFFREEKTKPPKRREPAQVFVSRHQTVEKESTLTTYMVKVRDTELVDDIGEFAEIASQN